MENNTRIAVLMVISAAVISACDSGPSAETVLDPEAYQYKGAVDPLLASSGADRAGGLADRFDLVQGRQ